VERHSVTAIFNLVFLPDDGQPGSKSNMSGVGKPRLSGPYGRLDAMRLLERLAERSKDNWIAGRETGLCECGHIIREPED
jgi:hypothetical protein